LFLLPRFQSLQIWKEGINVAEYFSYKLGKKKLMYQNLYLYLLKKIKVVPYYASPQYVRVWSSPAFYTLTPCKLRNYSTVCPRRHFSPSAASNPFLFPGRPPTDSIAPPRALAPPPDTVVVSPGEWGEECRQ
jgi:hypothetical protein